MTEKKSPLQPEPEPTHGHVHGPHCNHGHEDLHRGGIIKPKKPGRNDPCWCGSGKKFKKCCGGASV